MRLIDADALEQHIRSDCAIVKDIYRSDCEIGEDIGGLLQENLLYEKAVHLAIKYEPAVDAAPVVHGKWIYYNNNGWRVCSHCKDRRRTFTLDKYCPNCGAKMDGGAGDG